MTSGCPSMNPDTRAKLEAWLRYYEDLGLAPFYNDRIAAMELPDLTPAVAQPATPAAQPASKASISGPRLAAAARAASVPRPAAALQVVPPAASLFDAAERIENDSLERIRADIGDCTRCRLCQQRNNIVFGAGHPRARLVFVGEGPGRDEDLQGIPFVGRAGQLLTQMIEAMGLKRDDVYIANVVKCRPPENRTPERDEMATCSPFLLRQLAVIQPRVIVSLGAVAAQTLLGLKQGISKIRGEWFDYGSARLMATYHPAYLLRNPAEKATVWRDLQKVMQELGLPLPRKRS